MTITRKTGLTIDLTGSDGNVFSLLSYAHKLCSQLNLDHTAVRAEMMSGDYKHSIAVFDKHFGSVVTLLTD
jgi:hypothetical protein